MADRIAWMNTQPVHGRHGLGLVAEPGQLYADPADAPEGSRLVRVIVSQDTAAPSGYPHVPVIPAGPAADFLAGLSGPERYAAERALTGMPG